MTDPALTPLDPDAMLAWLAREAVFLQARGTDFGEVVYCCVRGRRHPVHAADILGEYGFRWPDDLQSVAGRLLATYVPAGHLPRPWRPPVDPRAIADCVTMREVLAAGLSGIGLEIGAGASAFPVRPGVRVLYGDRLSYEQLLEERYPGQRVHDIVLPDIATDFDTIANVGDESLDFVIACHVIEHTRDPIGSIVAAYRRLRPGGRLLLVIPDMERTFDRDRPLTPLEHLVEDHLSPDRGRDYAHYEEFYRLAQPVPEDVLADTVARKFAEYYAIHYHVWSHGSFVAMLDHVQKNVCRWAHIWTHPAVGPPEASNEFYAVLMK